MRGEELAVALVSLATLIAGVVVIMVGLRYRAHITELRHRERMAMIDKGLLPPPEFEAAPVTRAAQQRSRSFGIILVGLGFALMFLIGVAGGALDTGIGIGGAVAILGAAFIVRSIYATAAAGTPRSQPSVPAGPGNDQPA
jgi:hypothetical protein